MKVLQTFGNALLWVLAGIGVLSGVLWAAHAAGWVQPLVVVSGSMQPEIRKGDLLLALPTAPSDLKVGDVASIPNPSTGVLVTHRIVSINPSGSDWTILMEGDANNVVDPLPYVVAAGTPVWHPVVVVPWAGDMMRTIALPGVAIPLAATVIALIVLTMLPSPGRRSSDDETPAAESAADRDGAIPPDGEPNSVGATAGGAGP